MNGFLLVDKPSGMTSHDVVSKMRRKFGTKKIGHAGTLDPMATGVLVLGVGSATRLLSYVTDGEKTYQAVISLGSATHTDDKEGEVIAVSEVDVLARLTDSEIRMALIQFVGVIKQRPSSVSAIKIDGKPAHQRIREGEVVVIPEREVSIYALSVGDMRFFADRIEVDILVRCSAGTYIRAIARDLGEKLNVGGHLIELRRTVVSPFSISECATLDDVELTSVISGISRLFPTRQLDFSEAVEISFGRYLSANNVEGIVVAISPAGEYAALLENKVIAENALATPILVAVKE
jgi:tRNA pseudouridine55 synthase